jgi:uncharacterized protein (DUF2267 family)
VRKRQYAAQARGFTALVTVKNKHLSKILDRREAAVATDVMLNTLKWRVPAQARADFSEDPKIKAS